MRSVRSWRPLCVMSLLALSVACDNAADRLTAPRANVAVPPHATPDVGPSLVVSDVEQLYAAVNNASNAGMALLLEPGTYVLSPTNNSGVVRPNGGRLDLQLDMSLHGLSGDRSAVVIDARSLPTASFTVSFGRTAPVRMGRGSNAVEWLTIMGPPAAASSIATDLTGTPTTHVRVAHVVASGASRGVDVRNVSATMVGRQVAAEIIENELVAPTQIIGLSEGIRISNFVGAHNGVIVATMSGNRAYGFQYGCIIANNRSNDASITVRSAGDRFYGNAIGCLIAGGLSQTTGVATGNTTTFEAYGTHFSDNTETDLGFPPGGLQVVGGLSTTTPNVTSNNSVTVSLRGSNASDNLGENFEAFGAWMESLAGIAGTGNRATINLYGVSKLIDVVATASLPQDPNNTNVVTVVR